MAKRAKAVPANIGVKVRRELGVWKRKHPELEELRKAVVTTRRNIDAANAALSQSVKQLQSALLKVIDKSAK